MWGNAGQLGKQLKGFYRNKSTSTPPKENLLLQKFTSDPWSSYKKTLITPFVEWEMNHSKDKTNNPKIVCLRPKRRGEEKNTLDKSFAADLPSSTFRQVLCGLEKDGRTDWLPSNSAQRCLKTSSSWVVLILGSVFYCKVQKIPLDYLKAHPSWGWEEWHTQKNNPSL